MKYALLSIFILALLSVALTGLSAPAQNLCKSSAGGYCVNLAAVVPGLEFLGETPGDAGGLIARLFIFGLSLVGISALIMFVFAGVVYMTAGDSQSRVNQAKSFMGNAVFGLVLALISYLILYTINPDIVTKGFPVPKSITPSSEKISLPVAGENITRVAGTDKKTLDAGIAACQSRGGIPIADVREGVICIEKEAQDKQKTNNNIERETCKKAGGRLLTAPGGLTYCNKLFK